MKQQKSTFNSYNLFPDVNLIQNMVNLLFFVHILRFPPFSLARKNILEKWTKALVWGSADRVAAVILTECLSTADESVQLF